MIGFSLNSWLVRAGAPTPGQRRTGSGPWPVRNLAAQQEVSGERASEAYLPLPLAPHRSPYRLTHPRPHPSVEKLSSTKPVPGPKKVGDRWVIPRAGPGSGVNIYISWLMSSFVKLSSR